MSCLSSILIAAFCINALAIFQFTFASESASMFLHEIDQTGSKQVIRKYNDTPVWNQIVIHGIARADLMWLQVAERLFWDADGADGEDIGAARYDAFALAPFRVLPVLGRIYGGTPEDHCTITFELGLPAGGVSNYLRRIEAGLANPRTADEVATARMCRGGLAVSRESAHAHGLE